MKGGVKQRAAADGTLKSFVEAFSQLCRRELNISEK